MGISADIAIIGAGPSGLFSVLEAGILKMQCCIIDSNSVSGGQCSMLYPEKPIYDIPGHKSIISSNFIALLQEQIMRYQPQICHDHYVRYISKLATSNGANFELCAYNVKNGRELKVKAHSVIIAIGGGKFIPRRPAIDNLYHFENKSIFYSVSSKALFKGRRIVIAGGGDTAVDFALDLSEIAEKIYIVHRRDNFRCAPDGLEKLYFIAKNSDKVEFVIPYQLSGLAGDITNQQLNEVIVSHTMNGEKKVLRADILIPCFGLLNDSSDAASWGVEFSSDAQSIVANHATMATNIPNIYAIGDIAIYEGKIKSILSGFAEAVKACRSIYSALNPLSVVPPHSSR